MGTEHANEAGEALNLAQAIMSRFGELGGVELDLPPRETVPKRPFNPTAPTGLAAGHVHEGFLSPQQ